MLRPFLLVFDSTQVPRQEILDYLDTRREIKNWFAFMPSAVFVISDSDAFQISNLFRQRFPSRRFFVTEVPHGANDGMQAHNVWEFINNPKSSGRWT